LNVHTIPVIKLEKTTKIIYHLMFDFSNMLHSRRHNFFNKNVEKLKKKKLITFCYFWDTFTAKKVVFEVADCSPRQVVSLISIISGQTIVR
jgi:hypothetical protein